MSVPKKLAVIGESFRRLESGDSDISCIDGVLFVMRVVNHCAIFLAQGTASNRCRGNFFVGTNPF